MLDALEKADIGMAKKNFGAVEDINVKFSDDGDIRIFARKEVVEEVEDRETQISLEDAQKLKVIIRLEMLQNLR